jgi:hypothetical protein
MEYLTDWRNVPEILALCDLFNAEETENNNE